MSELIFNALPLTEAERAQFEAAAPGVEQRFLPLMDNIGLTVPLSDPTLVEGATVVLGSLPADVLSTSPTLKWLQTWSAGVDVYLKPGALPDGAMLTSAVGAYGPSVAEHLFACLLALMKRLPQYRDQQRGHCWSDLGTVKTLSGATVLAMGAGDIGQRFSALCQTMGAHTVGLKRTVCLPPAGLDEVHTLDELDQWLPKADVVVLALPQTPATIHIMDQRRLDLMKDDAILLNGGRGSAIDPQALAETLRVGRLWGAALDVTEPEPLPANSPLWDIDNLLLTPHVAGGLHLEGTRERIVAIALENLKRYLAGEPLKNRMK